MTITVRQLNRLCLLVCAPFLGLLLWIISASWTITLPQHTYPTPAAADSAAPKAAARLAADLDQAKRTALTTAKSLKRTIALYKATNESMNAIVKKASAQAVRPYIIYDRRITGKIGAPAQQVQSGKLRAQLFYIRAQFFNGYALKVKLKQASAMKLVLGKDSYGDAETTLAAAKRYHAVAGVNAGGFADNRGDRYPLSTTIVNGKYVDGFQPTFKDLFFVGLNDRMKLIGGKYASKAKLDRQKPRFGASFVPILMKSGIAQPIPDKWKANPYRAPRTVIANYKDDQLLFLVVDGYNESGSSGATLEEMQILLSRFGAVDGYNLDGGGSSTLIFNGRVVNHPSDGALRPLPTHFLFFK